MRIKSLLLSIVLIFSLSIPCFAMYSSEIYDNIASADIINGLPTLTETSNMAYIYFYNNKTNQYFYMRNIGTNYGGHYKINTSDDSLQFINSATGKNQFMIYYFDSSSQKWIRFSENGVQNFDTYTMTDFSLIKTSNATLYVDDKTFEINENGKIEIDGTEIEPPKEESGIDLGGLTNSIKNFFSGLLDGIINFFKEFIDTLLGFVKFLIDLIVKLFKVVAKLPNLLTGFTELQTTLFSTLENIAFNNDIAKSIMAVALLSFSISIANLFLRLFAGSKLGGDS